MLLRDFAAKCYSEFMTWTIKHTAASKQAEDRNVVDRVKPLFKLLYDLAAHRNPHKRLGALVCFNNIYRIWRTSDSIVEAYFFEVLTSVLRSLSEAHDEQHELGKMFYFFFKKKSPTKSTNEKEPSSKPRTRSTTSSASWRRSLKASRATHHCAVPAMYVAN